MNLIISMATGRDNFAWLCILVCCIVSAFMLRFNSVNNRRGLEVIGRWLLRR